MSRDGEEKWFSRVYSRFFAILAILTAIAAIFVPQARWAMLSVALGALALSIAWDSHRIAKSTDNKLEELHKTAQRLENLQNDIKAEQQQQTTTNTPIVASMTAISQLVEFFSKQKGEDSERNEKS